MRVHADAIKSELYVSQQPKVAVFASHVRCHCSLVVVSRPILILRIVLPRITDQERKQEPEQLRLVPLDPFHVNPKELQRWMLLRNWRELREKDGDVVVTRDLLWYFDDLRVGSCRLRRPLKDPLPSIPRLSEHLAVEIHLGQVRTAVLPRDERAALPRVFSELVCDCLVRCSALTHPPHRRKPPILQNVPLVLLRVPEVPHELHALPVP